MAINDIVAASHFFVARHAGPGDTVVDATAGKGGDTLFLARLVGPGGRVHAFDIQEKALSHCRAALEEAGLTERVTLHLASHTGMLAHIDQPLKAVMFNLGYLPGGDKEIVTTARDTQEALAASLSLLAKGGIITLVTYPGHPGGREEEEAVAAWGRGLDLRRYSLMRLQVLQRLNPPPGLWLVKG